MFRQAAVVAFLCALPVAAQQSSGAPGGGDNGPLMPSARTRSLAMAPSANALRSTFRLDVKLIEVPVNVTDDYGRPVRDLPQSAFRVFEDDVEQKITSFSNTDAPISAGLVFDTSGSMRNRLQQSRTAVDQFFVGSADGDEYFLVRFADSPELVVPFTRSADDVSRHLTDLQAHGWTALIDAVYRSIGEMRRAANSRRVLLVLSDGADNNSRYSEGELVSRLREADVRVFAIGLFERPRLLERLAEESGGGVIWVHKMAELPEAMEKLSLQIRNEYVLGYFSSAPNDGRYHKVRVEMQPSGGARVHASWRRGYTEP
jgi:Ca-activated chloride channel homolog